MLTDYVCIKNGTIILTDISLEVTLNKIYKKFEMEFKAKLEQKVEEFFNLNNWEYGQILKEADLIKKLAEIREIRNFEINFTTSDPDNSGAMVVTQYNEIIRPDDITINFIYE